MAHDGLLGAAEAPRTDLSSAQTASRSRSRQGSGSTPLAIESKRRNFGPLDRRSMQFHDAQWSSAAMKCRRTAEALSAATPRAAPGPRRDPVAAEQVAVGKVRRRLVAGRLLRRDRPLGPAELLQPGDRLQIEPPLSRAAAAARRRRRRRAAGQEVLPRPYRRVRVRQPVPLVGGFGLSQRLANLLRSAALRSDRSRAVHATLPRAIITRPPPPRRSPARPCAAARTCAAGTSPTAGTPAPARRPGSAARPPPARWRSRSGGRGPSPGAFITIQSSSPRTSPLELLRLRSRAGRRPSPGLAGQRAEPRAGLGRLLLADDPPHLVVAPPAQPPPCRTASCPVSSSYSSTPRRVDVAAACPRRAASARPARGTCTAACRPSGAEAG